MTNEIKILISVVAFLLLELFQIGINSKKYRRIRQLPVFLTAVIVMIAGIIVWFRNLDKAAELCDRFEFINNANILLINVALLLGYCIIRLLVLLICSKTCKKQALLSTFSLGFYDYEEQYDEWFLKKQFINFRKYFFVICIALNIFSGIVLGLIWAAGPESSLWMLIFPAIVVAILNEFYNFINGQTKEEFEHSVLGDDSDARRVSNYYKLREILENILPEPLLAAHTGSEYVGRESAAELLKQFADSADEKDQILAEYFNIDGRYKTADVDSVEATSKLLHHKNVVFFNPFYRDLSMYVTLPIVKTVLSGKKCVVLCGRKSATDDVILWLSDLLKSYSHMRNLWRVANLSDKEPECEIGIITFTEIYDKRIINANREFLSETDFVLLVEPSVMLNTSQIALSILAEEMSKNDEAPVYCVCDRRTDGIVDTLSHLLHSEITDVVAMPIPRCNYTAMSWNADGDFCRQQLFDKQTTYLGDGIELAAIAVKNQVPQVSWYGETKVPLRDIKWIAGQHYTTICKYMNQPSQQKKLYEKIAFLPNLWSATQTKEEFIIAEDEFCNMFSMMRAYLSRGENQTFVNVLSENYLLRDYMRCNKQMFMSNPNAIPSLVPDYAKTERNTILKLIIMMALHQVSDDDVLKELHLVGIETDDVFGTLTQLLKKYTFADAEIFTVQSVRTTVDEFTTIASCLYSITDEEFDKYFAESLKNAYFILEDEKNDEGYIDAKLFSHVSQIILPGQYVTYDGKYYVVKYMSPQSGVVLRRASDQFDGRKYYRQVRSYYLDGSSPEIVSSRIVGDVEFTEIRTDFHVDTTGYLEMSDSSNLRTARFIDLSSDPAVQHFSRKYHNKSILRIKLPNSDDKIRFTICLLLSETFKSIFPNGWQYITAITKRPDDIDGMLNYMVYPVYGELEDEYIYIIEDSDLDLGLLDAVEKNFMKLMEIIADFLDWHYEKMREPASKDPVPVKISVAEAAEKKKRNLVVKMLDRIRKLFGGKKQEEVKIDTPEKVEDKAESQDDNNPVESDEPIKSSPELDGSEEYELNPDNEESSDSKATLNVAPAVSQAGAAEYPLDSDEQSEPEDSASKPDSVQPHPVITQQEIHSEDEFEPSEESDPDLVAIDGTDIFDNDGMPEDNDYLESSFVAMGLTPITKSRYQRECFLKFGFEEIDNRIRVDDVRKYLRVRGWTNNSLTLARKRDVLAKSLIDFKAENHCDFCGLPLSGVSYDRLTDGRVRCNDCSSSAITNLKDFNELFFSVLTLMQDYFGIRYRVPISVRTTDARTVAKGAGMIFRPSTQVASRVLGYAQRKHGKYSLIVENGSPRLATIDTMVHEMTHIWQYLNWDDSQIVSIYGMSKNSCTSIARDIIYEGMAMWSSIQYLYQIGETYYAAQQEALADARQDVYGIGFRLYKDQYPLVKDSSLLKFSPFSSFPTLEPALVKAAVRAQCTEKECIC